MGYPAIREGRVSKACGKALRTEIECHTYIPHMNSNHYQKWVGDVELANRICTDTCSDSLRSWNDTVTKDCAEDMNSSDSDARLAPILALLTINHKWQGFNETCVKDDESGRYCQEILDTFSEINYYHHDRPLEELCHPCYGKVLDVMSKSFLWYDPDDVLSTWSTEGLYWRRELELTPTQRNTEGPTPDGPTDPGLPYNCTFFQTINLPLHYCQLWPSAWGLTVEEFVEYNPTVKNDCSGIQFGHSYCVEVNNGLPRKEGSPQVMTTEVVESQPNAVKDPSSSRGTLKDGYMEPFEGGKQVVLEKGREFMG
ncbi:hypothetical protein NW768_002737 [Fusarium equiseti]|uniref:LysM domain-containing protein n=1 Tax=Fusarium equiseti TaxID=61235 RepID=A0ABQ8RK94_FUSEQ|nr:hypothetical protein NW768_002737 [Fusarium equiseti]